MPKSNATFWASKFERNVARDAEALEALAEGGWRIAIVWECGVMGREVDRTLEALVEWIRGDGASIVLPDTPPSLASSRT